MEERFPARDGIAWKDECVATDGQREIYTRNVAR